MDMVVLQAWSDAWLSNSRTVHGENYNYELIGFQYSCAACEKVVKSVEKAKAPGKGRGKNRNKSKAGHDDGTGYVSQGRETYPVPSSCPALLFFFSSPYLSLALSLP